LSDGLRRPQQPKRQKLLGIKPTAGGLITDETLIAACAPPKMVLLMGCVLPRVLIRLWILSMLSGASGASLPHACSRAAAKRSTPVCSTPEDVIAQDAADAASAPEVLDDLEDVPDAPVRCVLSMC
jgi:hypothetical protein